jgi:hypothetical protein
MNKLTIVKEGDKTKFFLDDTEVQSVLNYKVKSSTNGVAELDLTIMVEFPVTQN